MDVAGAEIAQDVIDAIQRLRLVGAVRPVNEVEAFTGMQVVEGKRSAIGRDTDTRCGNGGSGDERRDGTDGEPQGPAPALVKTHSERLPKAWTTKRFLRKAAPDGNEISSTRSGGAGGLQDRPRLLRHVMRHQRLVQPPVPAVDVVA